MAYLISAIIQRSVCSVTSAEASSSAQRFSSSVISDKSPVVCFLYCIFSRSALIQRVPPAGVYCMEKSEKRIAELKRLFMKIYEDNAANRLSDDRYEMLSSSFETEQKQPEAEVIRLREGIEVQEKQNGFAEQFIRRLKDLSLEVDKPDGYTLHELSEAIYVEAPDKNSGRRTQAIHIKYDGIGFIPIHELMAKQTKSRRRPWKHYVFVVLSFILFYSAPALSQRSFFVAVSQRIQPCRPLDWRSISSTTMS